MFKEELKNFSQHRPSIATAHINCKKQNPSFLESQRPYATLYVGKINQQKKKSLPINGTRGIELINIPYKRISRVGQMIDHQKQQIKLHVKDEMQLQMQWLIKNHSLRPQFKIKTNKHSPTKTVTQQQEYQTHKKLHYQNLSIECTKATIPLLEEKVSNNYPQILKNRRKLHQKVPHKKTEASLLDMLNRVSEGASMQRYRSREFRSSNRVNPF